MTAFKWALGHTIAAAGILETALALEALARGTVPGVANLARLDPACAGVSVSAAAQKPRSKVALILCRGFAGTNAALVVRAA
jgi:3-oxoacyl-[acyl-carrier-protein] synthase-1